MLSPTLCFTCTIFVTCFLWLISTLITICSDKQVWTNNVGTDQKEQPDEALHCLPFRLHRLDAIVFAETKMFKLYDSYRVWVVRLYGKIIHERQRVAYLPYRRTNHTLTSLLHLYASALCKLRDI